MNILWRESERNDRRGERWVAGSETVAGERDGRKKNEGE
ncbi:hypothetical protein L195_g052809 [Trifolium pratense]|uniref:Uncharacterized protein n=1 Tax=Trifolium pratense TaxID=57577 RepID=A0A2K3K755_TRIPR|nr:hypothetical protein L195_g052809 [Trifolium pratense]